MTEPRKINPAYGTLVIEATLPSWWPPLINNIFFDNDLEFTPTHVRAEFHKDANTNWYLLSAIVGGRLVLDGSIAARQYATNRQLAEDTPEEFRQWIEQHRPRLDASS